MKLKFCTVIVHINTDILVQFHFDNCESSLDTAFSVMLLPSCPCTHSKCQSQMSLDRGLPHHFTFRNDVHFTVAICSV